MKKVRVVHVIHSFDTGGLEKGIAALIRHASPDIETVVLCLSSNGASARLVPPGTRIVELFKPPGNSFRFILKLSKALRSLHPHVVHTRNWGGMEGVLAARLIGFRRVVHGEHGWEVQDPEGRNSRRVKARRFLSRWVREYTCVSRRMKGWLEREIRVLKPVTQIYNGIDTLTYAPGPDRGLRDALRIPAGVPVIGTVGRLDPIKDYPTLLEAFASVRDRHRAACLVVVGDGAERRKLELMACQGVLFLGDRYDVPDLMRIMDVFVLPSINEGISNTILEAMASGLPVIASHAGGNPELVDPGRTGMLFPVGDVLSLCKGLCRYLEDPDLRVAHGRAARKKVVREFEVEKMVRAYEHVYRRIALQG